MSKTTEELLKEAGDVGKLFHSPFMMAVLVNELAANTKELVDEIKELKGKVRTLVLDKRDGCEDWDTPNMFA